MIKEILKTKEDVLKLEFKTKCNHALSDGKYRENLIQMLLDFIPNKFSVCNGFVFDSHNNISKEIDLIIYDSLYVPKFFKNIYSLIPIESVVGIIQVKTTLTKQELEKAVDNLNSIDALIPEIGGEIISLDRGNIKEKRIIAPLKVIVGGKMITPIHSFNYRDIDIIYTLENKKNDILLIKKVKNEEMVSNNNNYIELVKTRKKNSEYYEYKNDKMYRFVFGLLQLLISINNTLIINYKKYEEELI